MGYRIVGWPKFVKSIISLAHLVDTGQNFKQATKLRKFVYQQEKAPTI